MTGLHSESTDHSLTRLYHNSAYLSQPYRFGFGFGFGKVMSFWKGLRIESPVCLDPVMTPSYRHTGLVLFRTIALSPNPMAARGRTRDYFNTRMGYWSRRHSLRPIKL